MRNRSWFQLKYDRQEKQNGHIFVMFQCVTFVSVFVRVYVELSSKKGLVPYYYYFSSRYTTHM